MTVIEFLDPAMPETSYGFYKNMNQDIPFLIWVCVRFFSLAIA